MALEDLFETRTITPTQKSHIHADSVVKQITIDMLQNNPDSPIAHDLIERYNEIHDESQLCDRCGHDMEFVEGYRCAGWHCPHCGHEEGYNTYY